MPRMHRSRFESVTIAASAAASGAFELDGYKIVGIAKPATWTAADISFEIDPNGAGTFYKAVDSAGALLKITGVSTTVAEYQVPPEAGDLITGMYAKVVSTNTASEADVNQDAARTLIVVIAPLS